MLYGNLNWFSLPCASPAVVFRGSSRSPFASPQWASLAGLSCSPGSLSPPLGTGCHAGVCCRVCIKAAPRRSAGTPPSGSHPPWPAVGWAQGCSPLLLASQIQLGGGDSQGSGPGVSPQRQPGVKSHHGPAASHHVRPRGCLCLAPPTASNSGAPEPLHPPPRVPLAALSPAATTVAPLSAWLPRVPLPHWETHPLAPT